MYAIIKEGHANLSSNEEKLLISRGGRPKRKRPPLELRIYRVKFSKWENFLFLYFFIVSILKNILKFLLLLSLYTAKLPKHFTFPSPLSRIISPYWPLVSIAFWTIFFQPIFSWHAPIDLTTRPLCKKIHKVQERARL